MSLFNRKNVPISTGMPVATPSNNYLPELALRVIHDGVIITNEAGTVEFINPAAVIMTECSSAENALGLSYDLLIKIETKEGRELVGAENPLSIYMQKGQALENFVCVLVSSISGKRIPISISVLPAGDTENSRIITFRNIEKELAEDSEQAEFISTASHEMRTPVASIEGYLSLVLNPQTATIDERARGYITAAHNASKHLGKLFHDLLDVTKLDDGHVRLDLTPVELASAVRQIADSHLPQFQEKKLNYVFGAGEIDAAGGTRQLPQPVYSFIDQGFLREIVDNIVDNAIKYTKEGGSVYVNVYGENDRAMISVADTGIGISAEDLQHIFQKFYRADNSDTRTIGGTGLGLYLVKQRTEAMGGRVYAESSFNQGTTFYVSLPRITGEEYEKRMIIANNKINGGNIK